MREIFHTAIDFLVTIIEKLGYFGVFFGMLLESTPIPIPSEVIMIPAGIAAAKGVVDIYLVTILGIFGNVCGAVICYFISLYFGRSFIKRFGKYFFLKFEVVDKMELFFKKHGSLSVFIGRLLPGFRHFISIPAGLAKMDFKLFLFYTTIGSTIWTSILSFLGYFVGDNQELIEDHLGEIAAVTFALILVTLLLYILYKRLQNKSTKAQNLA